MLSGAYLWHDSTGPQTRDNAHPDVLFGINFALTSWFDKGVDGLLAEHGKCLNTVRQLEPIYHWEEAFSANGNGRYPGQPFQ